MRTKMDSTDDYDNAHLPTVGGPTPFGHAMRQHFLFDNKWLNLNHGSFGAYPVPVRNAKRGYSRLTEAAPDNFLRYQYQDLQLKAREQVAALLQVPTQTCVFVPNATMGVNTVLRNLKYKEKDVIVYFDTIYGACEKTLISVVESFPQLTLRKVGHGHDSGYALPCTHAEICNAFSQTISRLLYEGCNIRAAVFDTIVSIPGVRFPFERLTRMCKEYGILSIIDGAHAIGHIPLNLEQLDPDFFVSNCHKWLFTPRGCAVFYVPKRNQDLIRTSFPTSHGYIPPPGGDEARNPIPPSKLTPFETLFQFVATTDNTAYYCVPAAMKFRQNICGGEQAIYEYIRENAQRGADILATSLGTEVMDDLDTGEGLKATGSYEGDNSQELTQRKWNGGLRDCALATVLLPMTVAGSQPNGSTNLETGNTEDSSAGLDQNRQLTTGSPSSSPVNERMVDPIMIPDDQVSPVVQWMQETLVAEFRTFLPIFEYQGRFWTRISGQIYLELQDWEWLGGVLKELCERVGAGEVTSASSAARKTAVSSKHDVASDLELIGQGVADVRV